MTTVSHLVYFLGETLDTVDIDAAIIHDCHDMSTIRTDSHCSDGIVMGTNMEKQLAGMNVDEPHYAVLAQYTKRLHIRETKKFKAHVDLLPNKWHQMRYTLTLTERINELIIKEAHACT